MDPTQNKTYGPLNRCMYCRRQPPRCPNLSCEHIVPYGLGGNVEAKASVCDECKLAWEMVDRTNLKHNFVDARLQLDVQSRSKKDKRKRHTIPTEINVTTDKGPKLGVSEANHLTIPPNLALPRLMPPGILTGLERRQGPDYFPGLWHPIGYRKNRSGIENIG